MSEDERRPPVPANEVFGEQQIRPLPEGSRMDAAFILIKLEDGAWCARQVGAGYNRVEFLGQLSAYTHSLLEDEAAGWFLDDDVEPADPSS